MPCSTHTGRRAASQAFTICRSGRCSMRRCGARTARRPRNAPADSRPFPAQTEHRSRASDLFQPTWARVRATNPFSTPSSEQPIRTGKYARLNHGAGFVSGSPRPKTPHGPALLVPEQSRFLIIEPRLFGFRGHLSRAPPSLAFENRSPDRNATAKRSESARSVRHIASPAGSLPA